MKNEIIFVDDEEPIRQVASRMLVKDKFDVTTLHDGEYVVNAVKEKDPLMVFLDIRLPGKNGLDLLKEIKVNTPDTPVVMVSGYMNSDNAIQASKMGACDYILKPIDWKYLRNVAYLYSTIRNVPSA